MMRIACLGNSHLAAFKLGWETIKDRYPETEVDFFGAVTTGMVHLAVENGALIPTKDETRRQMLNTGGKDVIGGDYDAYIFVGMGLGLSALVNAYRFHRPAHLYDGTTQLISDDVVIELRAHLLDRCASVLNVHRLRQITKAPILVTMTPLPTAGALHRPDLEVWGNARVLSDCRAYLDSIIHREFGAATIVPQLPETLESDFLTKPHFTRDARLITANSSTRATNPGDIWHMNAEYGALFLAHLIERAAKDAVSANPIRFSA